MYEPTVNLQILSQRATINRLERVLTLGAPPPVPLHLTPVGVVGVERCRRPVVPVLLRRSAAERTAP